jgi:hypothetical protein
MGSEGDNLKWQVLRYIADSVRCGVCHRSFAPDEVVILSRQEDVWFVSISCDACGTESMILVILQSQPPGSAASTNLDADMVDVVSTVSMSGRARSSLGPITEDEIENLRRFLQGYHGNLCELWRTDDS